MVSVLFPWCRWPHHESSVSAGWAHCSSSKPACVAMRCWGAVTGDGSSRPRHLLYRVLWTKPEQENSL